jgi:hypothetical protein
MIAAHTRSAPLRLATVLATLALVLALPALAAAQSSGSQGGTTSQSGTSQTSGSETTSTTSQSTSTSQSGTSDDLAQTGFEAWQVGLLALVCLGGAFLLVRRPAHRRR